MSLSPYSIPLLTPMGMAYRTGLSGLFLLVSASDSPDSLDMIRVNVKGSDLYSLYNCTYLSYLKVPIISYIHIISDWYQMIMIHEDDEVVI